MIPEEARDAPPPRQPGLASAPARSAHAGGPEGSALTRSPRVGCPGQLGRRGNDSDTVTFLCFFPPSPIEGVARVDLVAGDVSQLAVCRNRVWQTPAWSGWVCNRSTRRLELVLAGCSSPSSMVRLPQDCVTDATLLTEVRWSRRSACHLIVPALARMVTGFTFTQQWSPQEELCCALAIKIDPT